MLTRDQIAWRLRENAQTVKFIEQAIQAERIRADLDDPVSAKIRELERQNATYRALLNPPEPLNEPQSGVDSAPQLRDKSEKSEADWYMTEHQKRLDLAQKRNAVLAAKQAPTPACRPPAAFRLERELRGGVGLLKKVER